MDKAFALAGALSAFIAVAAGAFGAHALRARLPADLLAVFETGARYQMYHALALLAVAWASNHCPGTPLRLAGWLFIGGTLLFQRRTGGENELVCTMPRAGGSTATRDHGPNHAGLGAKSLFENCPKP